MRILYYILRHPRLHFILRLIKRMTNHDIIDKHTGEIILECVEGE